ncbi:MAG: DUF2312 domain-containing protein [Parvibaculum sp.]|nr:DUF2312 domain-containing protein [Parvibaculum sp.]
MGKGTAAGKKLSEFITEAERIDQEKKALGDELKALFAAAKAGGFDPATMRRVLRLRKLEANERDEAEALLATYLHALGMAHETPLAKVAGLLSFDTAARDELVKLAKDLLPDGGEIVFKTGPVPVRLWKDEKGRCHAEDWHPPLPPAPGRDDEAGADRALGPIDVDAATPAEAAELGRRAADAGAAATDNPYERADPRFEAWEAAFFAALKKPKRGGAR